MTAGVLLSTASGPRMAARRLPFPARQEQFSTAVRHAFLLGDAVHIHSPAGGQGMNTGIGDAINLA